MAGEKVMINHLHSLKPQSNRKILLTWMHQKIQENGDRKFFRSLSDLYYIRKVSHFYSGILWIDIPIRIGRSATKTNQKGRGSSVRKVWG